jgi:hypothetical protein
MSHDLVFLAGRKAIQTIRKNGLRPEQVRIVVGAAGGPKWLVLHNLDRVLFSSWFKHRTEPLFLLGSSIGAWRFAAACQRDPGEALDRFLSTYTAEHPIPNATQKAVTRQGARILDALLGREGATEIFSHPFLHLNIVAARCKWPVASDNRILLSLGLMDALLYNAVHREGLKFFFERTLFSDPHASPPFADLLEFSVIKVPLSPRNLKHALLASASIPLMMSGVKNIPDAPKGTYRDGGVLDYHFDLPFMGNGADPEGIVLFPHYMDRIVPGWFDKNLPWRKPRESNMDNVVLISPSRDFIERLPYKKIPDRTDFSFFSGRDHDRTTYWNEVIHMSACLGEQFLDAVETGSIRERVTPMS